MLELIQYSKSGLTNEDWDRFVLNSDNGTIFHTRKFLSYHPKTRFKEASIVVTKNNKTLVINADKTNLKYILIMPR